MIVTDLIVTDLIVTDLIVMPGARAGAAPANVAAASVDVTLLSPADAVASAGSVAVSLAGDAHRDTGAGGPSALAGAGAASQRERLRQGLAGAAAGPRPRDPAWQQERRQRECALRGAAAGLAEELLRQGASAADAAALLEVPARTLRSWLHDWRGGSLAARNLGRPHARCSADQGNEALGFLQQQGPWVGLPTLRGAFPETPRAELRDLLGIYRHLWAAEHPRALQVLHWQRAGSVWAMDFTKVSSPIDDCCEYVFAVRDLASGLQLLWLPVADVTTATALAELQLLFTIHGAPLLLKSDNGSAFCAGGLKGLLARWQVWPLYSPPGKPGYNGAIEASIGSLKRRTAYQAERAGHAEAWTSADLELARGLANRVARPRGAKGATPVQLWESRRPPSVEEREAFAARVHELEASARSRAGIARDAELEHYEQAALHRGVLQQALVESGLLSITRRRLPQRFYGQKTAIIT